MSIWGYEPGVLPIDDFDAGNIGSVSTLDEHQSPLFGIVDLCELDLGYLRDSTEVSRCIGGIRSPTTWDLYSKKFTPILSDEEVMDDLPPPADCKPQEVHGEDPTYVIRREFVGLTKSCGPLNLKIQQVDGKSVCPVSNCRETFKREYNARMHILHVHLNIRKYKCSKCHWKSKRKYDMIRHLNTHRKDD